MMSDLMEIGRSVTASPLVALAWLLLLGVPLIWLAGQLWLFTPARRMGVFTPVVAAFVGAFMLRELHSWPF